MERKLCPKCQSNHGMQNLPIGSTDPGTFAAPSPLHTYTHLSWLGLPIAKSDITASICGDCGYTELYAVNHAEMLEEWRKRNA